MTPRTVDDLTYLMTTLYAGQVFKLWDQHLTAIDAFDADGALPIIVARAATLFKVAHPDPRWSALFPFELVRHQNSMAITYHAVAMRPEPARFSVGALFVTEAVQQALELSEKPNLVDLNMIIDDFVRFEMESMPSPTGITPPASTPDRRS